ncbi:Glycolate dehydrogenase, iron-sulfur subunit GlcF [hydrothermal vent metagenome]|uniref:Glycolate dehydrogenase, iron-sulfur subunit GlcF n=1 Tax=hydrothermal vent metagenome TaxID=652676 RepID=A0A3B0ZYH6_9ZZZZ
MQTAINPSLKILKNSDELAEADTILRSCVHCGFCIATCPTYLLLGDELDSPRGRIYLIKSLLEGKEVTTKTQQHLDRCLTCRSCETTCPSGVRYSRLLEIGRNLMEEKVPRPLVERIKRRLLLKVLPDSRKIGFIIKVGQWVKPLLPSAFKKKLPAKTIHLDEQTLTQHTRRMLVLAGCVQPHATPNTNAATARVLEQLGISLVSAAQTGCCGAINQHLSDEERAKQRMRDNIDAWWPFIENENPVEAIALTASGCGLMVKEYGDVLKNDTVYAKKALKVSALAKDISEILATEILNKDPLKPLAQSGKGIKVAYHAPCTLQHGQQITGVVEQLLERAGYTLTPVANGHLCCGSAGTYSLLQPTLSQELLKQKIGHLTAGTPDIIVTANMGCQLHLSEGSDIPVKHWIELLN